MSHDHTHCRPNAAAERLRARALEGCEESRMLMSRRAMLGVTASLFSWAYMPRWAEAATNDPRLLVVVLRGGMDGLNVCVPFGDSHYVGMRGDIAIPASSTINLDNFFGLHPALKNFGAMYKAKEAAVVHAVCTPLRTRSHFDCQDNLESGLEGMSPDPTGWLNRLLDALPAGASVKTRGAIEIGEAPLILRGPAPVLGWSSTWFEKVRDPTKLYVRDLYKLRDQQMYDMLERGLAADALATKVAGNGGNLSGVRQAFRGAGALIAAPTGPRIAVLSVGGWDTHSDEGGANGYMAEVLGDLDLAIADFKAAVGAAWKNTAVVMATEFGRTVHVNGDGGTDHGVATVALLAGGAINGAHVFGQWPGVAKAQLYEDSDLKPTTDLRSVFKGLLRDHIGAADTLLNNTVFPGSAATAPAMRNLIKTSAGSSLVAEAPAAITTEPPIARYRRGERVSGARA